MNMKKIAGISLALLLVVCLCATSASAGGPDMNVSDGDVLTGEVTFIAGAPGAVFYIDGDKVSGTSDGGLSLCWTLSGIDYSGCEFRIGNDTVVACGKENGDFSAPADKELFCSDRVVLDFIPATATGTLDESMVYGSYNIDDLSVSGVYLVLPDGSRLDPESVILHYPVVDASGSTASDEQSYGGEGISVGDGWNATTGLGGILPQSPIYVSFVFYGADSALESSDSTVLYYDTSGLSDGEHTLRCVTSGGETSAVFSVDNTAPEITVSASFGEALYTDGSISFDVSDPSGVESVTADIDGTPYTSGGSLSAFTEGRHTLIVTAADKMGNTACACIEFRLFSADAESEVSDGMTDTIVSVPTVEGAREEYSYDIGGADGFRFDYLGSTGENGLIAVYAYNFETSEYDVIGYADSGVKASFTVSDSKYISGGSVRIAVEPYAYTSVSDTVIWVTDTQYYSAFDDLHPVYSLILDYAVAQFSEGKAGYLIHTGDVVDTYSPAEKAVGEWEFASSVHTIIDTAGMPYGITAGNHDTNNTPADMSYFTKYFGADRFSGNKWYGGDLDNNQSHYDLITISGTDYLFLYLGNGVEDTDRTVAWETAVCEAYPDRTVIICVHAYLGADGEYVIDEANPNAYTNSRAKQIMEKIIIPNPNVAAVLCGHEHGASRACRTLDDGRTVWEILSDYQYAETGDDPQHVINGCDCDGEGYLRLITFGSDGTMSQTTYSPLHDDYNWFADDKDTFSVKLSVRESSQILTTVSASVNIMPESDGFGLPAWAWAAAAAVLILAAAVIFVTVRRKHEKPL